MQKLLVKYYRGESLTIDEVRVILEEYVKLAEKNAGDVIAKMLSQNLNHPIAHQLITVALDTSARYLSGHYTITRVFNKEGHQLMVY